MSKKLTITDIEKQIEFLEDLLCCSLPMRQWSEYVGRYHALNIKLAHMKGENPIANYRQSDYII